MGLALQHRFGFGRVDTRPGDGLDDLLAPSGRDDVFSRAERRFAGGRPSLERFAGCLAAKTAVRQAILACPFVDAAAVPLVEIEILPTPDGRCFDPRLCRIGHLPAVHLSGNLAGILAERPVAVSLSHDDGRAVAVAAVSWWEDTT